MITESVTMACAHINEADTWLIDCREYINKNSEKIFGKRNCKRRDEYIQTIKQARDANAKLLKMFLADGMNDSLTDVSSVMSDILLNVARAKEQKEDFINYMMNWEQK